MAENNLNKKAGKAGIWYTTANIFLKGCLFLTLPIFTRLLSPHDFGIYNTYMAYEALLSAILGLGLYGTVKNAKLDYGEDFNSYLSSVLTLSLICFSLLICVINLFWNLIQPYWQFSLFVTNCLLLQSYGAFVLFFYGSKLNIEFKYKSYVAISFINVFLNIVGSILLIVYVFPKERYFGRILGSAFPYIIIATYIIITTTHKGGKYFDKNYWRYAIAIGLPLVPHVVSQSLLSQVDRIMISEMIGSSEAGIYSYIYTLCTITYVICQSLENAWTPWVYMKLSGEESTQIYVTSKKYVTFFAGLTIGFICIMPEVTKIMASNAYWSGSDLLIPLSLANYCIFLYLLPVGVEYFNKKTIYISIGTISAAVINIILNYLLLPKFGYKVAAYTTLISYLFLFIFHWILSLKLRISQIYSLYYIIKITIFLFATSFLLLYVNQYKILSIVVRYFALFVGAIILIMNRKLFFINKKYEKDS